MGGITVVDIQGEKFAVFVKNHIWVEYALVFVFYSWPEYEIYK